MPSEKNMHSIQENRWRCLWENFVSMARYYCIVLSFEVPCSSRKKKHLNGRHCAQQYSKTSPMVLVTLFACVPLVTFTVH